MLELENLSWKVNGEVFVDNVSLKFDRDTINILLGPTLSGKTSLMRLMAGLDRADSGEIRFDGQSVSNVPVRQRNVAMVYQQFINYPNLSVFENIASPLRVAKVPASEITSRVDTVAGLLKLGPFLNRSPSELSGGQQQRVALARAIVKRAGLVLLDEPLANLDYKLREELRSELPVLFKELGVVLVYATTEPSEALVLGGKTACLHQGKVFQFGSTLELYSNPDNLVSARTFSDPPLNCIQLRSEDTRLSIRGETSSLFINKSGLVPGHYTAGVRPHYLKRQPESDGDICVEGTVTVTELTGSESFVHFDFWGQSWVALLHGISDYSSGDTARFYIDPEKCFLFDENEARVR